MLRASTPKGINATILFACGTVLLSLTACGGADQQAPTSSTPNNSDSSSSQAPTSSAASAEDPSASTEMTTSATPDIKYKWKTQAGYSFRLTMSDLHASPTSDVANQEPGKAQVTIAITGDAVVANTTKGRNAVPSWVEVMPAWKKGSAICSAAQDAAGASLVNMTKYASGFGSSNEPTHYCLLAHGVRLTGLAPLSPGEVRNIALDSGNPSQTVAMDYSFIVAEDKLSAAKKDASNPSFWVLTRGTGDDGVTSDMTSRVCEAGGAPVVATSREDQRTCAQGVQ